MNLARYVVAETGCWLWQGYVSPDGYGHAGRNTSAHRAIYETLVGAIPSGLDLDHLCRVRSCVNPDHLEPVTRRENLLRGVGLPAQQVKRTHCPQGHPYDTANTRLKRRPHTTIRECRACDRIAHARRRALLRLDLDGIPD